MPIPKFDELFNDVLEFLSDEKEYKTRDVKEELSNKLDLTDEERVVIATNKFKPDNIIVGQGFIAAESKSKAIEWLKIIRTALIFVDDNSDDLKKELNEKEEEKIPEVKDDYDDISNAFENFWD